jgi:bifunctional UDP-N-acetylglucosamine pyrophosphorylase/glucosamine-1-phosphate N-acetyltransferase
VPGSIDRVAAIVLAAGHGLRMRSPRPKVLHRVGGRPLIGHVLETLAGVPGLGPRVVVTSGHPGIAEAVAVGGSAERVSLVVQDPPRGTADAARVGLEHLRGSCDLVLITYGDAPLVRAETFEALLREHSARDAAATLVTARANDPSGYGRVLRDPRGYVRAVVEHRDADDEQRLVDEINGGVYVFDPVRLAVAIDKVRANNDQDEYYLTDVVGSSTRPET